MFLAGRLLSPLGPVGRVGREPSPESPRRAAIWLGVLQARGLSTQRQARTRPPDQRTIRLEKRSLRTVHSPPSLDGGRKPQRPLQTARHSCETQRDISNLGNPRAGIYPISASTRRIGRARLFGRVF